MILIPLNGLGNRFKETFSKPKALIEVSGKSIICWLLDNLKPNNHFIYIPYNFNEYKDYDFENFILNLYPNFINSLNVIPFSFIFLLVIGFIIDIM